MKIKCLWANWSKESDFENRLWGLLVLFLFINNDSALSTKIWHLTGNCLSPTCKRPDRFRSFVVMTAQNALKCWNGPISHEHLMAWLWSRQKQSNSVTSDERNEMEWGAHITIGSVLASHLEAPGSTLGLGTKFIDSTHCLYCGQSKKKSLIVDRTHPVLASGKQVLKKRNEMGQVMGLDCKKRGLT